MENIRKRVDVKLVINRKSALKLAAIPNFQSVTIFDENLIAIHTKRVRLFLTGQYFVECQFLTSQKLSSLTFISITSNQSSKKKQNSFSQTLILFSMKSKQNFFMTFPKISKKSLTHQIFKKTIHQTFQLASTKKSLE